MKPQTRSYLLLSAVILVWGVNWPVMKTGLHYMTPLWFGVARLSLGALCLLVIAVLRRRLYWPRLGDLPILLSLGVLQMGGYLALINLGLQHVEAGRSAILAYTTPLWVTPAAVLLLGERLTWRKSLGLAVALAGVVAMVGPWGLDWSDARTLWANGALLLAAVFWAIGIVHVRLHHWRGSVMDLVPWQMILGMLVLLPFALTIEADATVRWTGSLILILAFNVLFPTIFSFCGWVTLNRRLPTVTLSLAALATPGVGLISSVIALGEPFTAANLVGLGLISFGLLLVLAAPPARQPVPA